MSDQVPPDDDPFQDFHFDDQEGPQEGVQESEDQPSLDDFFETPPEPRKDEGDAKASLPPKPAPEPPAPERNQWSWIEEVLGRLYSGSTMYQTISENLRFLQLNGTDGPPGAARYTQLKFQAEVAERHLRALTDPVGFGRDEVLECEKTLQEVYGLEEAKENLLITLATRVFSREPTATPLLLSGPPGVGKTFLSQIAARGLGREPQTFNLGGNIDEATFTGSPVVWIGAKPGLIAQAVRRHGFHLCFIFDEIDKLPVWGNHSVTQHDFLQILDEAGNDCFLDNYLEYGLDLGGIPIIATANDHTELIEPLRNRFEVIELPDYNQDEKLLITRRYVLPKIVKEMGLTGKIRVSSKIIDRIVDQNHHEPGLRQIERDFRKLLGRYVLRVVRGQAELPAKLLERDLFTVSRPWDRRPRREGKLQIL